MSATRGIEFRIDVTPRNAPRVPFASETGLQDYVEGNAQELLGLEVIASDRRGGGRFGRIDILAVNAVCRPFIIECKHDLVDAGTFRQLDKYRADLMSRWGRFEERIAGLRRSSTRQRTSDPVLVTVGYRYDQDSDLDDQRVIRLAYRYHGVTFSDEELQQQKPGRVSLCRADRVTPAGPHPRVCKKFGTVERLYRLAPKLKAAFWALDDRPCKLEGVVVRYGGKNLVRYRVPRGQFAEATIGPESIAWRFGQPRRWRQGSVQMFVPSDAEKVFRLLRRGNSGLQPTPAAAMMAPPRLKPKR